MSIKEDDPTLEGFDEYTKTQMIEIAEILNDLQTKYDTRLLAALLSGRGAMLHQFLVTGGLMTFEEAKAVWDYSGEIINAPPEREVKMMTMYGGQIFDPSKTN